MDLPATDRDPLEVIQEIAEAVSRINRTELETFVGEIESAGRMFIAGAGRSGLMAKAFAMRLTHLGRLVHVVGETTAPAMTSGDTLVAVSGSGTTSRTLLVVRQCKNIGGRVLAVTADAHSQLARTADTTLLLPTTTRNQACAGAPTTQLLSSLFDQVVQLALDAVVLRLAKLRRIDNAAARTRHVDE